MSRVWLLNLDAEIEIEGRVPYPGPLAAITKRPELRAALAALIPGGDTVLRVEPARGECASMQGFTWSPSPRALACLRVGGADVVRPLPEETLRAVLSRGFAAGLGLHIEGSRFSHDAAAALAHVRVASPTQRWLVRRAFGFAGKARRVFSQLFAADERFVANAALEGGVLIEPFVDVTADFGLHGFVDDHRLVLGEPVANEVGAGGVFRGSRVAAASDLTASERVELVRETERAGAALRSAGYRGPYGVDAFRYTRGGSARFQPRCEINARYSMAWAVGMGERRPDLE